MAYDQLFGTWETDQQRSAFAVGRAPERHTRHYEPVGPGFKVTADELRNGRRLQWSYTAPEYDGKDYPVVGRSDADAIASFQLSPTETLGIFKKDGKAVALYQRGLSDDGRILTVIESGGDDGDGQAYFDIFVFNKQ